MTIKWIFIGVIMLVCGLLVMQPVFAAGSGATVYPVVTTPVMPPSISASAAPDHGPVPLAVQFKDTSLITLYYWYWDFGDGTQVSGGQTALKNPRHTYTTTGNFTVTLATKNAYGIKTTPVKVARITVTGSPGPAANFSAVPLTGCAPLKVNFSDTSTGDPTTWVWNFGDGLGSSEENPTHSYTSPGTYNVSLTAGNSLGNSTRTNLNYITVSGPPVAAMEINVTNCTPFVIQCRDMSTGGPTTWLWDFGDGNRSAEENPTYTYGSVPNGQVNVTLTVGNPCGNSTTSKSVSPNCVVKYTAKITVTSTDGEFPIQGSKVYSAPYIMRCSSSGGVGCAFYPDLSNLTYLGITDDNGILSASVPKGYVKIFANRTFSYEDTECPAAGVTWNGNVTQFFGGPTSVTVNLTEKIYHLCS